jgi:hypothetical protein
MMLDGESFLGGFASGFLARGFTKIGYGIYFTTLRVIGIDLGSHGGGAIGGQMAGFIDGQLMPQLQPEENARVINWLDGMKEFDMAKNQIQKIELKMPKAFGSGHIIFTASNGKSEKISLRHRTAYDRLSTLTKAFNPGLVSE